MLARRCSTFTSVNAKKHQYTIAIVPVDDTRFEKKNRAVNEPIYFYAGGSRQPMELVVNQVANKKISGYLSAPKVDRRGIVPPPRPLRRRNKT